MVGTKKNEWRVKGEEISAGSSPAIRSSSLATSLRAQWSIVTRRLRATKRQLLFLDFDGTLTPLQARPETATVGDDLRSILRRLVRHRRITIFIVSGRRRADVRKRVNVNGIHYLGLHGWERGGEALSKGASHRFLRHALGELRTRLAPLPPVWIEDKTFSFAVHYRGSTRETARRARAIVQQALKLARGTLRLIPGKKVWEVMPREFGGKGKAVRAILAEHPQGTLPIYAGDDVTDEPAFLALRRGLTIRVGRRSHTHARFYLCDPDAVKTFLERLEVLLG